MFYTILWLDYPTIMARYNIKKKKKVEYIKDLNSLTVSELTLLSVDYSLQTMVMVIIKLLLTVNNFNRPFTVHVHVFDNSLTLVFICKTIFISCKLFFIVYLSLSQYTCIYIYNKFFRLIYERFVSVY